MSRPSLKQLLQRLIDEGETQASISKSSGVPQPTISRILTGSHEDPRTSTANKILDFLEKRSSATPSQPNPKEPEPRGDKK